MEKKKKEEQKSKNLGKVENGRLLNDAIHM